MVPLAPQVISAATEPRPAELPSWPENSLGDRFLIGYLGEAQDAPSLLTAEVPDAAVIAADPAHWNIAVSAPVETVWRTITEPDQISQWFADRVDLVVELGAHGYMEFGDQGGPVVVETVDPSTRQPASRSAGTTPAVRNLWPVTRCWLSSH